MSLPSTFSTRTPSVVIFLYGVVPRPAETAACAYRAERVWVGKSGGAFMACSQFVNRKRLLLEAVEPF